MLQIKTLELKNFITYKHQIFDFEELFKKSDILLIHGKNLDDVSFANDNGSGKSIIYQGILFALANRTTRNSNKDLLIGKFAKSMSCTLELIDSDKTTFWIKRYRKHSIYGNGVKLKINGIEKWKGTASELNALILDTLSLSYRRIINTSIFESDDERSRFIYLGDKEGKALLSQIKGFEIFQKCHEIAKEQLEEQLIATTQLEKEIENLKNQLIINSDKISKLKENLSYFEEQESLRIHEELKEKRNEFKIQIEETEQILNKNKKKYLEVKTHLVSKSKLHEMEKEQEKNNDFIQKLGNEIAVLTSKTNEQKQNLKQAENNLVGVGSVCKSCGNKITGWTLKSHIKHLTQSIKAQTKRIEELTDQRKTIVIQANLATQKLVHARNKRQRILLELNSIRQFIDYKTKLFQGFIKSSDELETKTVEHLSRINKKISEIKKEIFDLMVKKISYSNKIKQSEKKLKIYKEKERYRMAWASGFGKEEIQSMALQTTVQDLNEEIKRISEILTDGFVDIQLLTEKIQGNKKVRNIFEFEISDMNKKGLPFKEWSKGQKKRIEIIVSFALMEIEQNIISEVFLDELFDGVDEIGINKIKFLLEEEAKTKGKRFIIFSHSKEIKNLFENKAYIQLNQGKSTLHLSNE